LTPLVVFSTKQKGEIPLMTGIYEEPTTDEIEYVAPPGEPSHVHIPRPSRRVGLVADKAGLLALDVLARCSCAED